MNDKNEIFIRKINVGRILDSNGNIIGNAYKIYDLTNKTIYFEVEKNKKKYFTIECYSKKDLLKQMPDIAKTKSFRLEKKYESTLTKQDLIRKEPSFVAKVLKEVK